MIGRFKKWIEGVVRHEMEGPKVMPHVIANSAPFIQIYRIGNGYIFYKNDSRQYHEDNPSSVIYCATPMEVARQIINGETLDKMGILGTTPDQMKTVGKATGSFINKI